MAKYLDKSGVTYLWNKIKGLFTDQSLNTKNKTYAGAINEINTKVGNLTGAFLWKGKFDTLPAVTNYEAGNVVVVGNKEYVLTVTGSTKTWEEFDDEGSYLLKSVAEETYAKKTSIPTVNDPKITIKMNGAEKGSFTLNQAAAGEVDLGVIDTTIADNSITTSKIVDGAVTSTKLATGARNPIILTESTTEVDEETYRKLEEMADATDVVFRTDSLEFMPLIAKDMGSELRLIFGYTSCDASNLQVQNSICSYVLITVETAFPYKVTIDKSQASLETILNTSGYLTKYTLSPVLQEIDLTGTDAERKAKLDQFETDWKAFTGADNLNGARFVGNIDTSSGVFSYEGFHDGGYVGYVTTTVNSQASLVRVSLTGSLTITPLFSHLEAIKIYDDEVDVADGYAQNLKNITAYKRNLEALGVDTSKPYIIPIGLWFDSAGIFKDTGFLQGPMPIEGRYQGYVNGKLIYVNATTGEPSFEYLVIDTKISPIFEAITIYTDNTPEHRQANLDNIAAYEANLQALGVDTTKGYCMPIRCRASNGGGDYQGYLSPTAVSCYAGVIIQNNDEPISAYVTPNGEFYATNIATTNKTVNKSLNAKSLEAITIKTGNTPDDKAANVAAIKAYVDNLKALGVDTTKGYMIPIRTSSEKNVVGFIIPNMTGTGYVGLGEYLNGNGTNLYISNEGDFYMYRLQDQSDDDLTTTSNSIVGAINEVNALAKSKQDALTSGTNIKTVNGQSLLGSGDIAISGGGGDVTKAGNNIFTGNNTFTTFVHFSRGIEITNANEDMHYYLDLDSNTNKFRISDDSDMDVEVTGVDTPTQDNAVANKKYVDDKVAAAGGGSAPVLIDINDISGSVGDSVPVDVFNKIANAASAKTPIFGYSKFVEGQKTTYEIVPLSVKNVSTPDTNGSLSIQFITANAYNSVGIMKRSDTECNIRISSSHPFALDVSVDKSSTRGIQSSAVWKEIHSEPMTVNTATSEVTPLSSTGKHKILCYADSGTQQYILPSSPVDGETFLFLKVKNSHTIIIQNGTGNQNIYNCYNGSSVSSITIGTATRRKITVTYSSTVGKWFLMADDFLN